MVTPSPSATTLDGLARSPTISIFPPSTAGPASERVLKKRAAHHRARAARTHCHALSCERSCPT